MAIAVETESPLGAVRLRRRLTLEEAAARARLHVDDVKALEENRLYRFPSVERAVAATLVYGTALGVSEREARELAGLPVPPLTPGPRFRRVRRYAPGAAIVLLAATVALLAIRPGPIGSAPGPTPVQTSAEAPVKLPPPWEIRVDVYNGTATPNAATEIANEIGGPLAYRIGDVDNADRSDYVETRVYFPPGAEAIASRLADDLGVSITALPGGTDQRRLIVIVGTDRASRAGS
jgi:LytR cell envelope-related transcriptional attenuator/Helix-turn-helix domain